MNLIQIQSDFLFNLHKGQMVKIEYNELIHSPSFGEESTKVTVNRTKTWARVVSFDEYGMNWVKIEWFDSEGYKLKIIEI